MRRASVALVFALSWVVSLAQAQPAGTAAFPPDQPAAQPTDPAPPAEPAPAPTAAPAQPAPAPAPAPPPPAVAPAPAPYPIAPPPAAAPPRPKERSGIVGIGRFGFRVAGGGKAETDCSGSTGACDNFSNDSTDYDDASQMALGADLLFHLSPEFRLGAGLLYVPDAAFEADGSSRESDLGSDLSLMAVVEGVFDVNPTTAITLRGQAGLYTLFPGGDLEDEIDDLKRTCDDPNIIGSCDVDDGPYPGFTFGGGPGVRFAMQSVSLRIELLFQWYTVKNVLHATAENGTEHLDVGLAFTGTRFFLAGGLEL